jgi:flagellin
MIINHNLMGANANRNIGINSSNAAKSMAKLSSGLRINSASDDAAGLAISEKMRGQINGLDQASSNAQDGISMVQTAEGALNETTSILQRMRTLSVQSSTGTVTDDDRKAIQNEVGQLKDEIDRIGNTTQFNTMNLLDGSLKSSGVSVGANSTAGAQIGKLVAGTDKGADLTTLTTAAVTTGLQQEKVKVDGTDITVNWQNLSSSDQNILKAGVTAGSDATSQNAAKDLIVKTINAAIDASGTGVAHISGYVDSAHKITLQSGTTGIHSGVDASAGAGIAKVMADGTVTAGTDTYNGTTITGGATTKFNFNINGVDMQASIGTSITGGTTTMAATATELQTDINNAITAHNTAAGASSSADAGYITAVKVNATDDGKLQIVSETGAISLSDLSGNSSISNLGLTGAQTTAGGNGGMTFQIGANKGQTMTFGVGDMRTAALGLSGIDVSSKTGAQSAITLIDAATKLVSSQRSQLGAVQNRLEHTINNLGTSSQNLTSAESRIRDVDMAAEMASYSKFNVESQAAQAMLAQANQQPQQILQLLR